MTVDVLHGDCIEMMRTLEPSSVDSIVTDPPAGISFMSRAWDGDKGGRDHWIAWMQEVAAEALRVCKPGAHALVWALPRTSHWTATAWENAGWTVRDRVAHITGQGFPKSLDVSRAIDRAAGAERDVVGRYFEPNGRDRLLEASAISDRNNWGANGTGFRTGEEKRLITAPATDAARQWAGWGTALKPAMEDWWLFRAPLAEIPSDEIQRCTGWDHWCSSVADGDDEILTARALHSGVRSYRARLDKDGQEIAREDLGAYVPFMLSGNAAQALATGTGALNVDATRVGTGKTVPTSASRHPKGTLNANGWGYNEQNPETCSGHNPNIGRWPPNLLHDGSDEVLEAFARFGERKSGSRKLGAHQPLGFYGNAITRRPDGMKREMAALEGSAGTAARFFPALGFDEDELRFMYCPKASKADRMGTTHPTTKPTALISWLAKLITPPDGTILDPFAGSGSLAVAAAKLGFNAILIEREPEYLKMIQKRLHLLREREGLFAVVPPEAEPGELRDAAV